MWSAESTGKYEVSLQVFFTEIQHGCTNYCLKRALGVLRFRLREMCVELLGITYYT